MILSFQLRELYGFHDEPTWCPHFSTVNLLVGSETGRHRCSLDGIAHHNLQSPGRCPIIGTLELVTYRSNDKRDPGDRMTGRTAGIGGVLPLKEEGVHLHYRSVPQVFPLCD